MFFSCRALLLVPFLLASSHVGHTQQSAPASDAATAERRSHALNRGVNLSGWYGGWGQYTPEHLDTWTTPADFTYIRASGLNYVRLCVDPVELTNGRTDSPASVAMLRRLDQSVDQILAAGLSLSITLFPHSDYKQALLTPAGEETFLNTWKFLAAHFATRDPERVFFDILNEPEMTDSAKWDMIQAAAVDAIRSVDHAHTLIATGDRYDSIDELVQVTPVKDQNVVYTFHFYEPFPFTHQGATWTLPAVAYLRNVPYPGPPELLAPLIAGMSNAGGRAMLSSYATGNWDQAAITRRIDQARVWADAHHVTIIANEFGAFGDTIPQTARAVYLHDVRTTLESLHIPWAEWDYRGNFGIVVKAADGTIYPYVPIFAALGLTVPAAADARRSPAGTAPSP